MPMDKVEYHFKKASQYGMLAMYYEHKNPEKHIHYYKKHFYHEKMFVHYYKMMKKHGYESSSMKCDNDSIVKSYHDSMNKYENMDLGMYMDYQ